MASSSTPNSFAPGDVVSWGPPLEQGQRLRAGRILELVAARRGTPEDETAERLLALSNTHRYVLVERIAKSRHSTVCLAIDRLLTRDVVIKIHATASGELDERVLFEARTMSRIDHPNVVRIFDLGIADGRCYSVIEPCDTDMHAWSPTRAWREILERILEAGHGLARLHAEGLIHGDIKPANILIKDGVAKVADFGLAAAPGRAEAIAGTPGYIAPEVAVGIRSASGDVFALAATAWACLFGVAPFGLPPPFGEAGAVIGGLVQRAIDGEFVAEVRGHEGLPRRVRAVLRRGLVADPRRRPGLEEWLGELVAVLRAADRLAWLRRQLPTVMLTAVVVLIIGLSAFAIVGRQQPAEQETVLAAHVRTIEIAMMQDDTATALSTLEHAFNRASGWGSAGTGTWSSADLITLGDAARRLAEALDESQQHEDATIAWAYATHLYRLAHQTTRHSFYAAVGRANAAKADHSRSR